MAQHTALGKKIIESLEHAIAYERGEYTPPLTRQAPLPERTRRVAPPPTYDAARIRAVRHRLDVSQRDFAAALNVSPGTVRAWEQGHRLPAGPSLRLLQLAEEHPEYFVTAPSAPSAVRELAGVTH
jgi:putative transcriptional regulator